jgi:hypothetical protein
VSSAKAEPSSVCRKRVLLVGDHGHRDFCEAVAWLTRQTDLAIAGTLLEAERRLQQAGPPDVVIFAQARPGQFSARQVERLHLASPLSRLVALLGSWCEGELRTGQPWPGVVRVLWHQWQPRMIPQLTPSEDAAFSTWQLPRTASLSEQMECAALNGWPPGRGLVAIHTSTLKDYAAIGEACRQGGYATLWYSSQQPVRSGGEAAAIWDAVGGDDREIAALRRVIQRDSAVPVIVLLDFLRRQDYERVLSAGAAAVLAKPFLVADVLWHLDAALAASRQARSLPIMA